MAADYPVSKVLDPVIQKQVDSLTESLIRMNEAAGKFQMPGGMKEYNTAVKQYTEATKQADAETKKLIATGEKRAKLESDYQKALTMEVKSINDAVKSNKALKEARDQVNASTEKGKKLIGEYNDKINQNTKFIKENSDADKQRTSGIGKYREAIIGAIAILGTFLIAGRKVIDFFKESIKEAMEEERQITRIKFAVNGNYEATNRYIRLREQLRLTTLFSEKDITSAITMGAELGRTEAQTRKMVETAMGMSRVTGKDLNEMMMALSATYEGQTGRLGKLAGEVKGLTDVQLRNGGAVDILNTKYSKFAAEGMDTMEGGVIRLNKAWTEFKERTGTSVITSLVQNFGVAGALLAKLTGFVTGNESLKNARDKLQSIKDNIAAMRAGAKESAEINQYLLDLEKKIAKESGKTAEQLAAEKEQIEKDLWAAREKYGLLGYDVMAKHEQDALKKEKYYALLAEEEKQKLLTEIDKKWRDKRLADMQYEFNRMKNNTSSVPAAAGTKTGAKGEVPLQIEMMGGEDALKIQLNAYNDFLKEKNKLQEKAWKDEEERIKDEKKARVELAKAVLQAANQLSEDIFSLLTKEKDNKINALDQQKEEAQRTYEVERDSAKYTVGQKNTLEKKYLADQKERDKERRKLEVEKAKYNKDQAYINAIINTALGVTAALTVPYIGIALAVIAAAMGAVEIALIASEPLPSYKKGRKGGKLEIADVHKGEIIKDSTGERYVADDTRTVLSAGASVLTADEVRRDYLNKSMTRLPLDYRHDSTLDTGLLLGGLEKLGNKFDDIPKPIITIDKHGITTAYKRGAIYENWINNRVRF